MQIGIELIAKAPIPGWCKTRMGTEVGNRFPSYLQLAFLRDTLKVAYASGLSVRPWIGAPEGMIVQEGTDLRISQEKDLGVLLRRILELEWRRELDAVVFLGADAPHAVARFLPRAVDVLHSHDVVLGPTDDGGVYLIGVRKLSVEFLKGVDWGTETVYRQLVWNAVRLKYRWDTLGESFDVDTAGDLERLRNLLRGDRSLAPATAVILLE